MSDLNDLLEAQASLQLSMPNGKDPREMPEEERALFIKDMTLALTDELHELLAEVGWKPWASSRHVNVESARGELIDAFHFFMNLALALDMDGFLIQEMYHTKRAKNKQRQEEGYDGVSTKCVVCGRALDDEEKLLNQGEEGCFDSSDFMSGYCRGEEMAIFSAGDAPAICNESDHDGLADNGFAIYGTKSYNEKVLVRECEYDPTHRHIEKRN